MPLAITILFLVLDIVVRGVLSDTAARGTIAVRSCSDFRVQRSEESDIEKKKESPLNFLSSYTSDSQMLNSIKIYLFIFCYQPLDGRFHRPVFDGRSYLRPYGVILRALQGFGHSLIGSRLTEHSFLHHQVQDVGHEFPVERSVLLFAPVRHYGLH